MTATTPDHKSFEPAPIVMTSGVEAKVRIFGASRRQLQRVTSARLYSLRPASILLLQLQCSILIDTYHSVIDTDCVRQSVSSPIRIGFRQLAPNGSLIFHLVV